MSSGGTKLIYTFQQRILTNDWTRMQDMQNADRSEVMRRLYNDYPFAGLTRSGDYTTGGAAAATPLKADVLNGLMVRCDHPTSIFIDPGVLFAWMGTPMGDDSGNVLCVDQGVTVLNQLPFLANAGAGPRIDVIECQPVDTLLTTLTRDIYDPATRLFTPVAGLDYTRAQRLAYRITRGVAGGGPPALSAGWLPLAVAVVQVGATGWDKSDFYDVRPLVNERVKAPFGAVSSLARHVDGEFTGMRDPAGGNLFTVTGWTVHEIGQYYAGGALYRSTCAANADFAVAGDALVLNAHVADNCAPGCDLNDATVWLFAGFPMGLPRWARYSEGPVGATRIPYGSRGILFFQSHNGVFGGLDVMTSGTVVTLLPTVCGFTGLELCAALAAFTASAVAVPESAKFASRTCVWGNKGRKYVGVPAGVPDNAMTFTLTGLESTFPQQASVALLDLEITDGGASAPTELGVWVIDSGTGIAKALIAHQTGTGVTGGKLYFRVEVPLEAKSSPYLNAARTAPVIKVFGYTLAGPVFTAGDAYVVGYKF